MEEEQEYLTLADGHAWSEEILDRWEQENWHTERELFGHLIHVLPQVYETLELFGYNRLAKKLQKSVSNL